MPVRKLRKRSNRPSKSCEGTPIAETPKAPENRIPSSTSPPRPPRRSGSITSRRIRRNTLRGEPNSCAVLPAVSLIFCFDYAKSLVSESNHC